MPATSSQEIRRRPREARSARLVLILGALTAFGPLSIDMYLPALPSLTRDLATSAAEAQLTLSACLVGLAVGQALAGPLSDTLGRRRPLVVGLVAYALASLLCAVAPSAEALIALRVAQGVAGAAGIVIARAIVRDLHAGVAAAKFFSLLMLVNGLAPILAPVVGGQLLRVTAWRGIFLVLAAIGAGLALTSAVGLPETLPVERRQTGGLRTTRSALARLLADRAFIGYALSGALGFAAMFAYISGSPFALQEIYGLSPQAFSLAFGTNALGLALAGQVNGRLVGRVSPARLLTAGLAASAAGGIALLAVVGFGVLGLAGVLPCLFVVVASLGFVYPNATALALSDHPRAAGSASAVLGVIQYVVGASAAPLVGLGGSTSALPMALVIAALASAALAASALARRASRELDLEIDAAEVAGRERRPIRST